VEADCLLRAVGGERRVAPVTSAEQRASTVRNVFASSELSRQVALSQTIVS